MGDVRLFTPANGRRSAMRTAATALQVRMHRILRVTRPHRATTPQARYPRFSEVAAHISHIAAELFDVQTSLAEGAQLYGDLETRLAPEDRERLARLYQFVIAHEEKFEHAAYVAGLLAGSGQWPEKVEFINERHVD
jgi:hypothetical protein